ncbi:MAG: response regulator transcription factor [Opitutaceae bacterium]
MPRTPRLSAQPVHGRQRVLLVDDHALMRESIASWIDRSADLEVCGSADSAVSALLLVTELHPDILVTDLSMPDGSGFTLIKRARDLQPDLPILVLSMHNRALYEAKALQAGAVGYCMKGDGAEVLVASIRQILSRPRPYPRPHP